MTSVINLYSGPGSGKSTIAAGAFSLLKLHGINCEYITEYAKDLAWEDTLTIKNDPFYISTKQYYKQQRLLNKVDYVITDSPLLLGKAYSKDKSHHDYVEMLSKRFDNVNYFVKRIKPYIPKGRIQTEEEAKEKDVMIEDMLIFDGVKYAIIPGNKHGITFVVSNILIEEDIPTIAEII